MKHRIIPMPNGPIIVGNGRYSFSENLDVDFGSFKHDCVAVFGQRAGFTFKAAVNGCAAIRLIENSSFEAEEYSLVVAEEGIVIEAATERGVIWALTSLYHLAEEGTVPCVRLSDAPKYSYRGLMLDCVRHFFSVEDVKKIIEEISLVKINVLHWHLSDDQGFRIELDAFPQIHQMEGQEYYTKAQIREIVAYAKLRGVEIIPEIDMPGHTSAIIAAMPHLSCHEKQMPIEKRWGIFNVTLCPGKEETYSFVAKMLDEVGGLFDSQYFHIGGDEAPTVEWETCEDCKGVIRENGKTDVKWLQSYFTKRVVNHLHKSGKKPIVWNDFLECPDAIQNVDVQFWKGDIKECKLADFFDNNGATVFSSQPHAYLDYPHCMISLQKVYEYTPIIQGVTRDNAPNTSGVECCVWTERISTMHRLGEMIFPRAHALAEAGWSETRDYGGFVERLKPMLAQLERKGIGYTPPESWSPTGAERRKLIFEHFELVRASKLGKGDVQQELVGDDGAGKLKESDNILARLQFFGISDPLLEQDVIAEFTAAQR